MDEADRQTIRENIVVLARDMDFDDVSTSLLSKGIFEEHHIEEFQSKPSQKKKSLELLSAIQRRGPKAFQALYESLVEIQPHLAKILRPAPPADDAMSSDGRSWISMGRSKISKPITQPGSPMDISLSETLTVGYKMGPKPLGKAVIINNKDFKYLRTRTGTDKDRDDLKAMFEFLGLTPEIKNNQTGKEIEETIKKLSEEKHKVDCVAVVILSHGKEGVVYGTDGHDDEAVEIHKLIALFNADKCSTLRGKPKLFFIQACRGEMHDVGVEATDGVGRGSAGDGGISLETEARNLLLIEVDSTDVLGGERSKIPNQTDVLLGYATIPGFVSYRNLERGSWFIQALTEVILQYAREEDLVSMMTMVNATVAKRASDKYKCKQTSVFVSSLCEKLFFFPSH